MYIDRKSYKFFIVYKTINLVNGKIYIGQHRTNNICDKYLGSSIPLRKDIQLYGRNNFKRIILKFCKDEKELNMIESKIVNKEFVEREDTYNIAIGGVCKETLYKELSRLGREKMNILMKDPLFREKQKEKLRNAHIKRKNNSNYIENFKKMREAREKYFIKYPEKRKLSQESILKMKNTKKERPIIKEKHSQFGTIWITNEIINIKIKKEDIIPQGFRKGRKIV